MHKQMHFQGENDAECCHVSSVDKMIQTKTDKEKWCLLMQPPHASSNCYAR